jgi:hypothetical protein
MRATTLLLASAMTLAAADAFAWGQEGHSIVAEIAQRRLTAEAREAIDLILGIPGMSLASIASWADDVRAERPETARWHFVNFGTPGAYNPATDCKQEEGGDCIIAEIQRAEQDLTCGTTQQDRAQALAFLVHFVGDIHQPMHTLSEGRGGNAIKVVAAFRGTAGDILDADTNLHAVWDSTIIRRTTWAWGSYVQRLEAGWLLEHSHEPVDEDPIAWALEANTEALWMRELVPWDSVLGRFYYEAALRVVDQQLGRAGVRLAAVLNRWLGEGAACS